MRNHVLSSYRWEVYDIILPNSMNSVSKDIKYIRNSITKSVNLFLDIIPIISNSINKETVLIRRG